MNKTMNVPLCRPSITNTDIDVVVDVLKSGWLAHGEYNKRFEELMTQKIGVKHAVSMNSCASALEVSLNVAGIKGEVILPSFTFVATANAVVNAGATPVFCEIDPDTRNVTAEIVGAEISPRTEAVIVVHYGGQPCPMGDIVELCRRHNLFLVEDSAQTLGAAWNGRAAGSFGVGCFSFFPTKNITTGEGGMLTCDDNDFAQKARAMIAHGITSTTLSRQQSKHPWIRAADTSGHNYRMPNPLAALGYMQLKRLDELNGARQALAETYDKRLSGLAPAIKTPSTRSEATHVFQMYTIEVMDGSRNKLLQSLMASGIGASVHYDPPVHLHPYYLNHGTHRGMLPETEALASRLITLPLYPGMSTEEQDWVIECLERQL